VEDFGKRNISRSRSGSLADLLFVGVTPEGDVCWMMAGRGPRTGDKFPERKLGEFDAVLPTEGDAAGDKVGVDTPSPSSGGGDVGWLGGTVRLEDRDWRPPTTDRAGERGSGVRLIDTPEMNSVGDFGIPVSDSYSLELSVSM